MTEREDFLARWSRRKREIEEQKRAADARPQQAEDTAAEDASTAQAAEITTGEGASRNEATDGVGQAEPEFDFLSQLPSIESITATTDIRPFLTPGVPLDLTRAALRRAWSVDPNIRDYIGLAENQWDFASGDIPGFGPLELTEDLRKIVEQIVGGSAPPEPEPAPATVAKASEQEPQATATVTESPSPSGPSARPSTATLEVRRQPEQVDAAPEEVIVQSGKDNAAMPQDQIASQDVKPPHRGHGGALPH